MAKSEKAAAAIAALYSKKPGAALEEYLEVAAAADGSVAGMPKRSFNATYLLPLKRAAAPKKPRKRRAKAAPKPAAKAARRGRRKAAPAKPAATKRRGRKPATVATATDSGSSQARRLVLERDQQLLAALRTGGDPKAAYELAASIDDFVTELVEALRRG